MVIYIQHPHSTRYHVGNPLQALVSYISAHNLAAVYETFKKINFEELVAEAKNGASVLPNTNQQQFCGTLDLRQGLKKFQFNKKPRFDLSRSETIKMQDFRDFEQVNNQPDL